MTMDELSTNKLEFDVGRLFSAAPLSPAGSLSRELSETLYLGRASEARLMMNAVRDPAKHIVLYGERGVGKTSLANTFWRKNNTLDRPILAARVQVYPFDDFSSLWSRALEEFQTVFRPYVSDLGSDFAQVSPDIVRREFQKLPPRVGAIMIIDEFDLLRSGEARELTAHLLKSLHDHAIDVTVLLIGVAENVEELISNHQSLRRVLSLVKLERMNANDLNEILDSRLRLTPLRLLDDARSEIVTLSCGLPYYVQILGKFAALNAIGDRRGSIQNKDVDAAIENFLVESGQSFVDEYQRATDSQQADNHFREVILASALAFSDASGVFTPSDVAMAVNLIAPGLIAPGRGDHHARVQQYLSQFILERRSEILTRTGTKGNYRYRFSDALMQPFIIMKAIKDHMIDERLRRLLFGSGEKLFRDADYRLGVTEAYAVQLGMISPTVTEETVVSLLK
jgi:hypothetical protein